MKGKNVFTTSEITELRRLIVLRLKSASSEQKGIRDKMRKIGFYGRDDWGITDMKPSDLDSLIASGRIRVVGGSRVVPVSSASVEKPVRMVAKGVPGPDDLLPVLNVFRSNCFDPKTDGSNALPDSAGNYLVCLRAGVELPHTSVKPEFTLFNGLRVLYTGIAGTSLRHRDYKAHFSGCAGRSTLRKSLGVLFGYRLVSRDSDPATGRTRFSSSDEDQLSGWMRGNLLLFFYPSDRYGQLELALIKHFDPPLNLKDGNSAANQKFRAMLSELRAARY